MQGKLELVTGATATLCELEVYDSENKLLRILDDEEAKLGSCGLEEGFRIHVSLTKKYIPLVHGTCCI